MEIGISLASFYPQHPEDVVQKAAQLGFRQVEFFVNTISELSVKYIDMFYKKCLQNQISVYSLHPFTSALENYLFFSRYDRRVRDALDFYKKYFEAAEYMGACVINMHGDRGLGIEDLDEYISCIYPLLELSARHNATISQENVFYNSVNNPEFVARLRQKLGAGAVKFTLDIKQAHKGGTNPIELAEAMGSDIINVHMNDYDDTHICMLPTYGKFDFSKLKEILISACYKGPLLIEVYNNNYKEFSEIQQSATALLKIFE